jgi:hypothetical protein
MTSSQIQLLRSIAAAIVDAVKAAGPLGAPGGVIYAAMSAQGCTLNQFTQIMAGMVRAGLLTRDGDLYHVAGGAA